MTTHEAQLCDAILKLCARVEALEGKYETQRLATLEWGKDVDTQSRLIDKLWTRVETLPNDDNSKPTPNSSQIRSLLVGQVLVSDWIRERGCAKSSAYKWLGILGIRPRREVNRATGKVASWLTNSEASILTAYADALDLGCRSTEARTKAWDSVNARLVNRVNDACLKVDEFDDAAEWSRAAIREVALWLNEAPLDLYPGDRGIVVNALYDQANQ